ncbi:coiled-coil domain-containing protein 149-like [Lucilia sericata]|uniref:coiled-coil domain-containing protein 149-like n=1 Tax=Lucilia sericata TaxID=13632 RepID=UPI0018A7EA91|nr:coiled-coil domain-containing protein 149-like [Lucilia sericata]XP_037826640.1 coiled-coil domain-containing protein 149-like [Lucilia sericata]
MSDDESMSLGQYKIKASTVWTQRKRTQQGREVNNSEYDEMFGEHMENYSVETTALHRKLQSKMEALRILRKELEKFRTERDQFKLMAETLQLRYAALRRNSLSDMGGFTSDTSGVPGSSSKTSVAKILHESRERNIKLTTEVEALKQKLSEVQGDIEVLRGCQKPLPEEAKKSQKTKVSIKEDSSVDVCTKDMFLQWKQERSNFICHLEQLKKKNAQLAFDLKAVIDEKEELTNERDAYKCKAHRLNHELLVALKAKETHPKFLDIDSIILENKYLNERLKNIENEVEITKHSLSKYKTMLETKRKKGIMKLGAQTLNFDENILSHKQVKNLLESGIDLPTKTETIQDLKTLCLTLLDNLNDKNLALNHQKKTNKILATKIAELEQRMKSLAGIETSNDDQGFSASEFLLRGYCPSLVDTNSNSGPEEQEKATKTRITSATTNTTFKSTTSCGESQVTEDSGTMSSENEESIKITNAGNSDDAMSSLSTESGRSIQSSEYDLTNQDMMTPLNLNDFTDAALFTYKTPSTTSGSAGGKTQRQDSSRSLILPNAIVRERNDDLKDLPPELAALVQKALHELDLRDFDEVVGGICEDVAVEAKEEEEAVHSNIEQTNNDILEEELNSEDGAIGGVCSNLIEAN